MKVIKMIFASVLLAGGMSVASADEPVALTEAQMDNVTAAGLATAGAFGDALGVLAATTLTTVGTSVQVVEIIPIQAGQITVDLTQSVSHSEAAAL